MRALICLCFIVALALAEKAVPSKQKTVDKRGLLGLGYGHAGLDGIGLDDSLALSGAAIGSSGLTYGSGLALGAPATIDLGSSTHTHTTITRNLGYAVPQPIAVPVDRPVPVHVPYRVDVPVDRPYPVAVPKPYPVTVERTYAVPVDRPVAVPVPHPVHVPVLKAVGVPVPAPYPVPVAKPYAVHIPHPVAYAVPKPYAVSKAYW